MLLLDLTLDSPAENLASTRAAAGGRVGRAADEVLRLWEPRQFMIVLGSSSRMLKEVRLANVRQRRIEILRHSSGGAAVMAGPGCLMYALVLDRRRHGELRAIDTTHRFVLDRLVAAARAVDAGCGVPRHERPGRGCPEVFRQQSPSQTRLAPLSRHAALRFSAAALDVVPRHAAAAARLSRWPTARRVRRQPVAARQRA